MTWTLSRPKAFLGSLLVTFSGLAQADEATTLIRHEIASALEHQIQHLPQSQDFNRHQMGDWLRECRLGPQVRTVIVAFEGTASFDPRRFDVMLQSLRRLRNRVSPEFLNENFGNSLFNFWSQVPPYPERHLWSGVMDGPLLHSLDLWNRPDVAVWHFPSEEFEVIAQPETLSFRQARAWGREVANAQANLVPGINSAQNCYLESHRDGVNRQVILLAHSSGVRSAIKFGDWLGAAFPWSQIPLAFGVDPVEEAQWALLEITRQYFDWTRRFFSKGDVAVHTRRDRAGLYKPSQVTRWVSVYQNQDRRGLEVFGKSFGIRGSPVSGGENHYLHFAEGDTAQAHGRICYAPLTLSLWRQELGPLLGGPQP